MFQNNFTEHRLICYNKIILSIQNIKKIKLTQSVLGELTALTALGLYRLLLQSSLQKRITNLMHKLLKKVD